MEYMKLTTWGETYDICAQIGQYVHGNGLAIQLYFKEGEALEPYANLTVNLMNHPTCGDKAFIDTNGFPEVVKLIDKYKLGKPTGRIGYSGYCIYPEYEFDRKELEKYTIKPPSKKKEKRKDRDEAR